MKPVVKHRTRAGYTLAEIVIATTLSVLVVAGVATFFMFALNIYYYDLGRNMVAQNVRDFTNEMIESANSAKKFYIYPDYANRSDLPLANGESGNMVVFVSYVTDKSTGVESISRIVGYYRKVTDSGTPEETVAPIRKFTSAPSTDDPAPWIVALADLPKKFSLLGNEETNPIVIDGVRQVPDSYVFYNLFGNSVVINCSIEEKGRSGIQGKEKKAFSMFNFTVSPRE